MNMADNDDNETPAQVPATVPAGSSERSHAHFKLLPFWLKILGPSFMQVECVLANRNVCREFNKYCLITEALPHNSL